MKTIRILNTAALCLLFGSTFVNSYAQERPQESKPAEKAKPAAPAPKAQQPAKPAEQARQAAPAKSTPQAKQTAPAQRTQSANKPAEQAKQVTPAQHAQPAAKPAAQAHQAAPAQGNAQRAQPAQRAGNGGGHIPDARFQANFGRAHTFHVDRAQMIGSSPRFQYGGFWFGMLAPWPVGWQYTDNVYVDYIDGAYFLCDPIYPTARIAISVTI